jgi:hypothetical protein
MVGGNLTSSAYAGEVSSEMLARAIGASDHQSMNHVFPSRLVSLCEIFPLTRSCHRLLAMAMSRAFASRSDGQIVAEVVEESLCRHRLG